MKQQADSLVPRLLSIADLPKYYGGNRWFWRERIWRGEIPAITPGGKKQFIDQQDVEKWILRQKSSTAK